MKIRLLLFTLFCIPFLLFSQDDYTYDGNGNLKSDANKGITNIEYNHLNLPTKIEFDSSDGIEYLYDANGTKLQKKVFKEGGLIKKIDYLDGFVYVNDELKYQKHAEGFVFHTKDESGNKKLIYTYHYLDHLGNVRLLYADLNKDGEITQNEVLAEYNYYPFGMKHEGYNNVENKLLAESNFKKGFQSQEMEDDLDLGWYDFNARTYDPAIGRFNSLDPMADHFNQSDKSPYAFGWNNPVRYDDPNGKCPICPLLDIVADVGFALYDVGEITYDYVTTGEVNPISVAALGADITAMAIPMTTGAGLAVRASAKVADKANDAKKVIDKSVDFKKFGGKADTNSVSSKEAFRKAKDQNGIPRSQQPDKSTIVREKGTGKPLKQYEFTNSKGNKVEIRRDNPKQYGDGGKGDQGKHFNAGNKDQKLKQHHNYNK